ncbi:MAG: PrsW family intramembrane metalloprotease [Treponemataceae bacterium]|nr:PrsW family intramembrane metalloprotease [Treponemataceae bacterium]
MISKIFFYLVLLPALLPVAIILYYVYSKDKKEREPLPLLLKTILFGALFSLPCIPLEKLAYGMISSSFEAGTIQWALVQNVFGVALIEEFFKFLVIMLYIWKNRHFDYRYDGIVYAVSSSLGFAALENIIYILNFGTGVSIGRAIFAIPGHATFGVMMGFFLSRAKDWKLRGNKAKSFCNLILSLAVPMVIHGIYDFLLSEPIQAMNMNYIFFIYVIILDVAAFFTIRHDFKTDRPLGVDYTIIE